MLKSVPKLALVLFGSIVLVTSVLLVVYYFKLHSSITVQNESGSSSGNNGYLLPAGGGYVSEGYTNLSSDNNHFLIVGRLLSLTAENSQVLAEVDLSVNKENVIDVIFTTDATYGKFFIQEQKNDDLFPVSADYTTNQLTAKEIASELRSSVGKLVVMVVTGSDSVCNQQFMESVKSGLTNIPDCNIIVYAVNTKNDD